MKRTLLKIAILALTFGLGVGISVGWHLYQWSLEPYEVSPTAPWPLGVDTPARLVRADKITIVGGMAACGPEGNYHTTELSDGTQISQSCEQFSSPLAAARALKIRTLHAEIVERSTEQDENGRVVGEKILTAGSRVMRFSLYGKSLCVTDAPSLTHLRLYESSALQQSAGNE